MEPNQGGGAFHHPHRVGACNIYAMSCPATTVLCTQLNECVLPCTGSTVQYQIVGTVGYYTYVKVLFDFSADNARE